ncbi:MAG: alpha/beta hydrolase [Ferroplasma sp.]
MEIKDINSELNGKNIHYLSFERGTSRSVILLHGSESDSYGWSNIDALRKISQWGFNVYACDLPGSGKSEKNTIYSYGSDPSRGAKFIKDFADSVYAASLYLIAPSTSAGLALKSAIDYPNLIASVIIIGGLGVDHIAGQLNKLNKPVLILWGSNDDVVPISHGARYHDLIASSTFIKINGAGHSVQFDKPDAFFNSVKNFLSEK